MGWFKSLQRASRIHEWLPSVARDADRLAEERSKATGLQLPPPDDARAGVWYTYNDHKGEVAQSALPTNVSVVILHCVGTSSFFLYVLFTSFASEALASQAFDERSSEGLPVEGYSRSRCCYGPHDMQSQCTNAACRSNYRPMLLSKIHLSPDSVGERLSSNVPIPFC